MTALGASTTDLSTLMSLQAALAENGVPPELIVETLKMLLQAEATNPGTFDLQNQPSVAFITIMVQW